MTQSPIPIGPQQHSKRIRPRNSIAFFALIGLAMYSWTNRVRFSTMETISDYRGSLLAHDIGVIPSTSWDNEQCKSRSSCGISAQGPTFSLSLSRMVDCSPKNSTSPSLQKPMSFPNSNSTLVIVTGFSPVPESSIFGVLKGYPNERVGLVYVGRCDCCHHFGDRWGGFVEESN